MFHGLTPEATGCRPAGFSTGDLRKRELGIFDILKKREKPEMENKKTFIYIGIALVCLIFLLFNSGIPFLPQNEIDYQGEKIKLAKYYFNYDSYKNDPENLDPSELGKIEKLITEFPVQTIFNDRVSMVRAMFELQFPGYGLSSFGERVQEDGNVFAGYSVEIPRAKKERILVYHKRNKSYHLVDDFISPVVDYNYIMGVKKQDNQLVYTSITGDIVIARPLNAKLWSE